MTEAALTPMMQQYRQMKAQVPSDALLLFRLGDFYELFFDDAKIGADILKLTLTQRNGVPMCGVPHHAAQNYIARLVQAGKRVALCEQMEEPKPGKVVRREITQILSPGSVLESDWLDARRPNYIAAACHDKGLYGFAFLDTTTGDFRLTECRNLPQLQAELQKIRPAELVVPENWEENGSLSSASFSSLVRHDGWTFQYESAFFTLRDHFKTQSLDGFGCQNLVSGVGAAGGLLHYVAQVLRRPLQHAGGLRVYQASAFMMLDETTRSTLELVEPARRSAQGTMTLLSVLDRTSTGMGARKLRDWILHPLQESTHILERQAAIGVLMDDGFPLSPLRERLSQIRDIERCIGRLSQGSGNGRDLLALKDSLLQIPELIRILHQSDAQLLESIRSGLNPLPEVVSLITKAINEDCPLNLREGGVIANGFNVDLDELRSATTEGKDWILKLQQKEQERTGIKSLKVRYNSVFGYYIEVTKSNLASVPTDYHRKQTTANAERFITQELKEMEAKILGAEEHSKALEAELFEQIRLQVLTHTATLQQTADYLASLDVLASLAEIARINGYCRPIITHENRIEITEGRHPVLEQLTMEERFVPNDVFLDHDSARLIILTGPNMAGKSTYLRQVALLTLMAHLGSYIPAKTARIGLVDRIFTRVGASDDLSRGQSTFMVEMNETANILHHATEKSLVVLDEIGRGTSTFDGLSIAWAVAEYLHNHIRALTLFATHYHETATLAPNLTGARLMKTAVREWNDQVIFLRKIVEGSADKSYGIQVARLAGLPKAVLERASKLLIELEAKDETIRQQEENLSKKPSQLSWF